MRLSPERGTPPSQPMFRDRVPTTLAALSLALLSLAVPAGAHAADPVTGDAISKLLGGQPSAAQIREGQYSPDKRRILFRVLPVGAPLPSGGENAVEHSGAYWTVRADGTQATQVSLDGDDNAWVHQGRWKSNALIDMAFATASGHGLVTHQKVVAGPGGTDVWTETLPGEAGTPTPDGRFRVEPFSDLVLDDREGGPSVAYEVATGKVHVIGWAGATVGGFAWRSDCGDAGRNPAQTLLGAVSGATPACRFARTTGDGNAPGDADWASAAQVAEAVDVAPESIYSARFSPDRTRVLFKIATDPVLSAPSSDPLEGDFWVARVDGTQLRRLTTSTGTAFQAQRARWTSNAQIELEYGSGTSVSRIVDGLTTSGDTDCWNTATPAANAGHAAATTITSTACAPAAPPILEDPKPGGAQQPATGQSQQSQPVTSAPLLRRAQVLAVGKRLGGKKKNLLTVKFTGPAGYGLRVTLALRDGGRILAKADLTGAQAKAGSIRLKLNAKSRKLLKKSKGRVTVRVVPLSDG